MPIENKVPGKDVLPSDLTDKFPLVAKKNADHTSKFTISGVEFGGDTVPIFAGPNMVESERLINDIAKNVKKSGAHFLRGGAFKPLSFPYRSEKYNETRHDGLKWMHDAGKSADIPIITEVMDQRIVDDVAEVTDIIQIGSRNMQNYPLLTECAQTGKPLMLKRHYGASLRDWLGAAEYLLVEGNEKVILCERGIRTFETYTRNTLDLSAIPAIKKLSHLPILVDPSHASGKAWMVDSLSKAAIVAGADGLIIEVHNNPEQAITDGHQSITPSSYKKLVGDLRVLAKAVGREI